MTEPLVLRTDDQGMAFLTLNHPQKRNALSVELMQQLKNHLDDIRDDRSIRVVVLRANGPVFSSGHNLKECHGQTPEAYTRVFVLCSEMMETVRLLPQPVIAEVAGLATAAGCQLVATCDLAIASSEASFATPGVKIGLFCTTPGVAVARAVQPKKALEMLLTGQPITAEAAQREGLINRVVPPEDLQRETIALARQIAQASTQTVAIGKRAFYEQLQMNRPEAYAYASKVMVENLLEHDAQEGIEAFLQKREPVWDN